MEELLEDPDRTLLLPVTLAEELPTRETAELLVPALGAEPRVEFDASFYLADLAAIRIAAESWPEDAGTVLVLGHNPGWEQAASLLAGRPVGMTTANAALFESDLEDAEWSVAIECGWRATSTESAR